jgi:phytoene/squalene synthetase
MRIRRKDGTPGSVNSNLASSITKAASRQTYYTIRFLVDRDRVEDAYRSYGYFRWVDDVLDADSCADSAPGGNGESGRRRFLERQKSLLDCCYRGEPQRDVNDRERILVELVGNDREANSGLQAYLRNMMRVMDFDAGRRGRWISQAELDEYTRWLAVAVTENMHYFIGHGSCAPRDGARYSAVAAAHIAHMIRDTYDDVRAGYFNIPREVLEINRIGPQDVDNPAYRAWVKDRVRLARGYFREGKDYFRRIRCPRHRLAGFAYISRFEWLLDTIERERFTLRPQYNERKSMGTGLKMTWLTLASVFGAPEKVPGPGRAVWPGKGTA